MKVAVKCEQVRVKGVWENETRESVSVCVWERDIEIDR